MKWDTFFFKYLTAEIELYYSNVHLATPLSDKRLPIIVQSYKLTPVTARIGHCDEIWRDLRTTAKEIAIRFRTLTVWYWHQAKFVNEIPKDCLKCYMITRRWIAAFFSLINFTAFITVKLYRFVISYKYIFNKTKHVYRVVYRHNIMTIQLVAFKGFSLSYWYRHYVEWLSMKKKISRTSICSMMSSLANLITP